MKGNGDRVSSWVVGAAAAALLTALLAIAYTYFTFLRPGTPISSLRDVPRSAPVHLIGVVTYVDEVGHRFWLEDETEAAVIPFSSGSALVWTGQTVAVDARKMGQYDPAVGPASLDLQNVRVYPSRVHIKLPAPSPASTRDFPPSEKDGVRVQIDGVVEQEFTDPAGHGWLYLTAGGNDLAVMVAQPSGDSSLLIDAKVRVVGIAERVAGVSGYPSPQVWVPAESGLQLLEPPPKASPLKSVRDLYREDTSDLGHRVTVRGRVAAVYPDAILLEDQWGATKVSFTGPPPSLLPGAAVEATGFPYSDGLSIDLHFAQAREIPAAQPEPPPVPALAPITTVARVRGLSAKEAAQALPVQIEGVITFCDPIWHHFYLQDSTGEILCQVHRGRTRNCATKCASVSSDSRTPATMLRSLWRPNSLCSVPVRCPFPFRQPRNLQPRVCSMPSS